MKELLQIMMLILPAWILYLVVKAAIKSAIKELKGEKII